MEMVKEVLSYKERLMSSARSGKYWKTTSNIENCFLNNAPYCPVFHIEVVDENKNKITVIRDIKQLTRKYGKETINGLEIPRVRFILEKIAEIGEEKVAILHNVQSLMNNGYAEYVIFDVENVRDPYAERKKAFEQAFSYFEILKETKQEQGHLELFELKLLSSVQDENWEEQYPNLILFNHALLCQYPPSYYYFSPLVAIKLDNEVIFRTPYCVELDTLLEFTVFSYEHVDQAITIRFDPCKKNYFLMTHPFPEEKID